MELSDEVLMDWVDQTCIENSGQQCVDDSGELVKHYMGYHWPTRSTAVVWQALVRDGYT